MTASKTSSFRRQAERIVSAQRHVQTADFTERDKALVNRIVANLVTARFQKLDPRLVATISDFELMLSAAKKKKKKSGDDDLPAPVYELVSALKMIMGSGGQTIAALRDSADAGMSDEDAEVLAAELRDAAEKIKSLLEKVKK